MCNRGEKCHLYFSALVWLYWNRFVRSYADATYRIDGDEQQLLEDACRTLLPISSKLGFDRNGALPTLSWRQSGKTTVGKGEPRYCINHRSQSLSSIVTGNIMSLWQYVGTKNHKVRK